MKPLKVGLLGLGTVGSGVVKILERNKNEIARRAGREIKVVAACAKDINKKRSILLEGIKLYSSPQELINDKEIEVVVEVMGGTTIAKEFVLSAIENKKQVVTANKALIAEFGNEIFEKALTHGIIIAFEAAVAGGIPIIKTVREGLSANRIQWLAGIINGTSNFILTQMRKTAQNFSSCLQMAQEAGYAEASPTFDIGGIDAAHKLAILAAIAFGIPLEFPKIYTESLESVAPIDMAYTQTLGYEIKQIALARRQKKGIELRVHPTLVPNNCLLSRVDNAMNAVLIHADAVGPTLYYGKGAGSEPTASAVVADLIDVSRSLSVALEHRVPHLAFQPEALETVPILSIDEITTRYYLRLYVVDKPGILAKITRILGNLNISIETLIQKKFDDKFASLDKPLPDNYVPIVMVTHPCLEGDLKNAIKEIEAFPEILGSITLIRIETLDSGL